MEKIINFIIAMIFAVIHKNLVLVLHAGVALLVVSFVGIAVSTYGLSWESPLTFHHIFMLIMSIMVLIGLGVVVCLSVVTFKTEKELLRFSLQNSPYFKRGIIFFIFYVVVFSVLAWSVFFPKVF